MVEPSAGYFFSTYLAGDSSELSRAENVTSVDYMPLGQGVMSLDKSWQRLIHKNQTRHLRKPAMRKNGCTKPNNMVQRWAADIYPQFSTRSTISSLSFTDDNLTHTEVVLHCNGKQPKRSSLGESSWAELVIVEEWLCWHYLNPSWILLLSLQLYSSCSDI